MFVIIVPCDVENDCHINANCEWVESETRNKCVCIPGYEGNGYDCVERDISCLIDVRRFHIRMHIFCSHCCLSFKILKINAHAGKHLW